MLVRQAVAAALLATAADATVTSTSTFERCTNDADNCETKLTMQINLQSGANAGEEVLISQVGCADGLCNGADAGTLNNTVKLTFYHTRPVLSYSLYYFADFNAKPKEVVVYGGQGADGSTCGGPPQAGMSLVDPPALSDVDQCFGKWLGPTCRDGGRDPDVSCGWLYPQSYIADLQSGPSPTITGIDQLMGVPWQSAPLNRRVDRVANVVPDSQGFCCDCEAMEFLFESYDISRGNIACNALDDSSPHASAHCLRMDKLWYSAYDIGQSRENYNIFINIETCDAAGNHCVRPEGMRITSVGPERPKTVMRNAGNDIRIEWAPFGSADNALDLSSRMLLRPNCHGNPDCLTEYAELSSHLQADGTPLISGGVDINEPSRWLIIPRSDISMTGNDCNQIGLTYAGFRNQGENKCVRPFESCLDKVEVNGRLMSSASIKDYFAADMESVASNSVGRFFPQFIYPGSTLAVEKNGDDFAQLQYEVDEYRVSQLTLIMSGELVSVMEYTGELDVVDFGLSCMSDSMMSVSCFHNTNGAVESASNDGLLAVTVRNVGEHPDMFNIGFPSEMFEIDNGEGSTDGDNGGRYTNMRTSGNADLSPIQAKSTDMLQGRGGCATPPCTKRCDAGHLFRQTVSEQATQCWEQAAAEAAGRRLQGAVDPTAGGSTFDSFVQCGGGDSPSGLMYPDLRDDCDTVAFQVHSNNGLDIKYCVHVEIRNNIGEQTYPQLTKQQGAIYSEASRQFVGGVAATVDTTLEEQMDQGRVCFNTTAIEYMLVGDAESGFAAGGEPLRVLPNTMSCSVLCPTATDFICMMSQPACSDSFLTVAILVVAVVLGAVVARKLGIGPCGSKKKTVYVKRPPPRRQRADEVDMEYAEPVELTANPLPEAALESRYGKE